MSTVTSISPTSGPTTGGTLVTVTGTGFISGTSIVTFGGLSQTTTFVNSTSLTFTTPSWGGCA